ncbi:beta 1-4 rhamnosyltransferase Cps2T [Sporolactobacillus nakayamae]|uniref:Rhamnosyltransferase n=1 Tax=Sporolactobacillus nakayamae TaxID=269670 RepID=A0A1I2W4T7_9BACL|nr:DUF1972 domain-containing protein [Sporolactobacillus nakayamae]SFG96312.1 rhamnosyltransferase [Sporolactobacillus nakayamae]
MVDVFIIGSKGIPAKYGGFETFVDQLTKQKMSSDIKYHVACLADNNQEFTYNNVRCFNVNVPEIGSAKAIIYDLKSLKRCINYIKEKQLQNSIVYVLACRIGPFIGSYKKSLIRLGAKLIVNPDGHEWLRSKWSKPVRTYWKLSERLMVKNADLLICDSKGIEDYIHKEYGNYNPKTKFIAYGADIDNSSNQSIDIKFNYWLSEHQIKVMDYYLIVGRFVPENNYELMIREFMKSKTSKSLVIISNVSKNSFYEKLLNVTHFNQDPRIKFVGTVYDKPILQKVREFAFGYLHGHEVGGTNPSLLEALASTKVNLLLDVIFNIEVGKDCAVYFNKQPSNLAELINRIDMLTPQDIENFGAKAKRRIECNYSWNFIVSEYENLFLKINNSEQNFMNLK